MTCVPCSSVEWGPMGCQGPWFLHGPTPHAFPVGRASHKVRGRPTGKAQQQRGPGPTRSEAERGKGHDRLDGGRWWWTGGAWRAPCKRSERRGGLGPRPHGGAGGPKGASRGGRRGEALSKRFSHAMTSPAGLAEV